MTTVLTLATAFLAHGLALGETTSPEPQATDADSTGAAYRDQSDDEALVTAQREFRGLLDSPPLKWPPVHGGEEFHGYLNDQTAVVSEADGRRGLVESTLPLRGETPEGESAPIDLGLIDVGAAFAPKSSAAQVRIPDRSTGELRFPEQSFGVRLAGAEDQGAAIRSNKAFFANVIDDGDLVLEPHPVGAELSVVLRSPDAPTTIPLQFDLGGEATLHAIGVDDADSAPPGSVEIRKDGFRVGVVYPAVAFDADGKSIPVHYGIDGDRITMDVDTSGSPTWPILVDPVIGVYDSNGTSVGSGMPGYTWPNWKPATFADPPGSTSSNAYSYCNNQPTSPNKKFYVCQGTLNGTREQGGPIYVKANASQSYAVGDWAEWYKTARAGSYIYQFDATAISTVATHGAQFFMGVVSPATNWWENPGKVIWGNGTEECCLAATASTTALSNATRYVKVHEGGPTPATPIVPGNTALLRMQMSQAGQTGTPLPYIAIGGGATYSSETSAPTLNPPTHSNAVPSGWVDSYTDTVTAAKANDVGLGMGTVKLTGPGVSSTASVSDCEPTGTPTNDTSGAGTSNHYDACELELTLEPGQGVNTTYTAPEGINSYAVTATDLVGNRNPAEDEKWTVKVDATEPIVTPGGELDWARTEPRLTTDQPDLHVSATDENDDDALTSGVRSIEVKIDGVSNPATQKIEQQCPDGGCPLEHTFQLNTTGLSNGVHTVNVLVTDWAGNVSDQLWSFTIDRASPLPPCSDPSADPEGCSPDPPSTTAPSCTAPAPTVGTGGGTVVTSAQAVATTQQYFPWVLSPAESAVIEKLTVAPGLTTLVPLSYQATAVMLPSTVSGITPSYTVGSSNMSACIGMNAVHPFLGLPQFVNNTALEYPNTAASVDTILRPTPFGVQEFAQIRDATSPEVATYTVALQSGQRLEQLEDGSVAVIDPSLPTISSTLPVDSSGDPSDPDDPAAPDPDGERSGDDAPESENFTDSDLAGLTPDDDNIEPAQTQFQYESEERLLSSAEQDVDGQAVAIITPPYAEDAAGRVVPASMAISGTNSVTVTTAHRGDSYSYPVMRSNKTATVTAARQRKFVFGFSEGKPNGIRANNGTGDGIRRIRDVRRTPPRTTSSKKNPPTARYVMLGGQDSCKPFIDAGEDIRDPDTEPDEVDPESEMHADWRRCRAASNFVKYAVDRNLAPYITFEPNRATKAGAYAKHIQQLWNYSNFTQVKAWGPTNEPDHDVKVEGGPNEIKLDASKAARIWRNVKALRLKRNGGCACVIVAGEFWRHSPANHAYNDEYMAWLKDHGANPHVWALHAYFDVIYRDPTVADRPHPPNPSRQFAYVRAFARAVRNFHKRGRVWLSEQGVLITGRGAFLSQDEPDGDTAAEQQFKAAGRFLKLGHQAREIDLVNYYSFFGCRGPDSVPVCNQKDTFDSGLVHLPDPPPPRTPPPYAMRFNPPQAGSKVFRPTYCKLVKEQLSRCYQGQGQ